MGTRRRLRHWLERRSQPGAVGSGELTGLSQARMSSEGGARLERSTSVSERKHLDGRSLREHRCGTSPGTALRFLDDEHASDSQIRRCFCVIRPESSYARSQTMGRAGYIVGIEG